MIKNNELEQFLKESLTDLQLSTGEKHHLRDLGQTLDLEQARFIRNRAFDLVRDQLDQAPDTMKPTLKWLEQVIKTLDVSATPAKINATACFSPGDSCRNTIIDMFHRCRQRVDICVFTIADDKLTEAISEAHQRGIHIRIISDNDKSVDDGSDIRYLKRLCIPVVMDNTVYHMHHKFALFDSIYLVNGSFNWTRSASQHNYENLLITDNQTLVHAYQVEFNKLWQRFAR